MGGDVAQLSTKKLRQAMEEESACRSPTASSSSTRS